jgi:hypothetical protein
MHFVNIKRVSGENLEQLQREIDQVLDQDLKATGLLSVPNLDRRQGRCCGQNWGSRALYVHRPGIVLRWARSTGQTEWEMGRADQSVQARQRPSAPHTVPGRVTEHSSGRLPLWGFLSAFGGSWDGKGGAGVAVMRKMVSIDVHLIQMQERYDPGKVAQPAGRPHPNG